MFLKGDVGAKEFRAEFDRLTATNSGLLQRAWMLVLLAKHARLRMRSNSALNNWFSSVFPELRFEQVQKTDRHGRSYLGLQITERSSGAQLELDEDE